MKIFSASVVIHMHEKPLDFLAYPYLYDSYQGTNLSVQFFRESNVMTKLLVMQEICGKTFLFPVSMKID